MGAGASWGGFVGAELVAWVSLRWRAPAVIHSASIMPALFSLCCAANFPRRSVLISALLCALLLPMACVGEGEDESESSSLSSANTQASEPTGASTVVTTTESSGSGSASEGSTAGPTTGEMSTSTSTGDATESGLTGSSSSGSTTGLTSMGSTSTGSTSTGSTTMGSTGSGSDSDSTTTSGDLCVQCGVTLDSTQSSSFVALGGTEFMGFATLENTKIIYALDEVGSGRVIYTADTNLLYKEITDCPLWEWLGDSGDQLPKVLSFGRNLCGGLGNNLGNYPDLTYAGVSLPAQYVNNPAQLAADYDAVIYCTLASTSAAEAQTIVDYVKDEGGGLYLASEYWGFLKQGDLDSINAIGLPLGVEFQATNLDWGQANGEIDFECFPLPQ